MIRTSHAPGFLLGDLKLNGGGLALVARPFVEQRVLARVFGIVGVGVIRRQNHPRFRNDDGSRSDDTTIFGDFGLGYMQPLQVFGRNLNLRAEARFRYDVQQPPRPEGTPSRFQDVAFNLGVQIPLSRAAKQAPEAHHAEPVSVQPPAPRDP